MEAKDTVMSDTARRQFRIIPYPPSRDISVWDIDRALLAQAEITYPIAYKAGYDKALAQLAEMTEECKQLGRKEVVEWMDAWWERGKGGKQNWYELEAKLKEWGM